MSSLLKHDGFIGEKFCFIGILTKPCIVRIILKQNSIENTMIFLLKNSETMVHLFIAFLCSGKYIYRAFLRMVCIIHVCGSLILHPLEHIHGGN